MPGKNTPGMVCTYLPELTPENITFFTKWVLYLWLWVCFRDGALFHFLS